MVLGAAEDVAGLDVPVGVYIYKCVKLPQRPGSLVWRLQCAPLLINTSRDQH